MTKVLPLINKNHLLPRVISLLIGTFLGTLVFNMFFVPNNLVIGGVSGLAIIIKEIFNVNTTVFINVCNIILVILSFIMIGKKKTVDQLVGTVAYLIMLNITEPIARMINFSFSSNMLMLIFSSVLWGVANGLIYKPGYSTGGSDFLVTILSDKLKIPITGISMFIQVGVILTGLVVFSFAKVLFSIFIIFVSNKITNMILFGISTSKMVYIISDENKKIENYIMNKIKTGISEVKINDHMFHSRKEMLFCVVHNAQYSKFREEILSIDKEAFVLSNNCYEVSGGRKLYILPF